MIKFSIFSCLFLLPLFNGFLFKGPSPVKFKSTANYALQNDATEQFRKTTISVISVVAGFTGIMTPNFGQLSIPAVAAVEKTIAPNELKSALNEYKQALSKTEAKQIEPEVLAAKSKPVTPSVVQSKIKSISPKSDSKTPPAPPAPIPPTPSPPKEVEYKIKPDVNLLNQLSQTRNSKSTTSTPKTTSSQPVKIESSPKITVAPPVITPSPKVVASDKPVIKTTTAKPAPQTKKIETKKVLPEEIALKAATDKLIADKTLQTKLTSDIRISKSTSNTLKSSIASIEKDIAVEKKILQKKDLDKKEGEKSLDSIISLQKKLSQTQKDLLQEESKTKKLTSDIESIKKQLSSDESAIKSKETALKTRQAELVKAAKEAAERKAAEAAALKAKAKAELVKKSEGEVATVTSQIDKIKQDITTLSTKYQSELKVLAAAENKDKKASVLIKQKQIELEKAKAEALTEATKLKTEADKVTQIKKQIEATNQQLNEKLALKTTAEKTLANNRALK